MSWIDFLWGNCSKSNQTYSWSRRISSRAQSSFRPVQNEKHDEKNMYSACLAASAIARRRNRRHCYYVLRTLKWRSDVTSRGKEGGITSSPANRLPLFAAYASGCFHYGEIDIALHAALHNIFISYSFRRTLLLSLSLSLSLERESLNEKASQEFHRFHFFSDYVLFDTLPYFLILSRWY